MELDKEAKRRQFLELILKGEPTKEAAEKIGIAYRSARRYAQQHRDREASKPRFGEHKDPSLRGYKRFVITSIQNGKPSHKPFYAALKRYCKARHAKLLVVPCDYEKSIENDFYDCDPGDLYFDNVALCDHLMLLGRLPILPTIVDPLAGLSPLTKGKTIIVSHPQLAMDTVATLGDRPAQMWTPGTITKRRGIFSKTKTGYKAEDNLANAALVVELGDGDSFHIRDLNCDKEGGFYDIAGFEVSYWTDNGCRKGDGIASFTGGDEHWAVADPVVMDCAYFGPKAMVKWLRPEWIVRHDSLDGETANHWDDNNYLIRYGKAALGRNCMRSEANYTFEQMVRSTPVGCKNLWVASNHPDHFQQQINTMDPRKDLVNSKFYHHMCYLMMDRMVETPAGPKFPNLIKLMIETSPSAELLDYTEFTDRQESFFIAGVDHSLHGDKAANGSRGSKTAFASLPVKTNTAHKHGPHICRGNRGVGTFSIKKQGYALGPSNWMHTVVLTFLNGCRMTVNIINGKCMGPA